VDVASWGAAAVEARDTWDDAGVAAPGGPGVVAPGIPGVDVAASPGALGVLGALGALGALGVLGVDAAASPGGPGVPGEAPSRVAASGVLPPWRWCPRSLQLRSSR
jgi:hypothetical protein